MALLIAMTINCDMLAFVTGGPTDGRITYANAYIAAQHTYAHTQCKWQPQKKRGVYAATPTFFT
jgi:hypothetical protein